MIDALKIELDEKYLCQSGIASCDIEPRSNNQTVRSHRIVPLILYDPVISDENRTKNRGV